MRLRLMHWRAFFFPCTLVLASSAGWGLGCSSSSGSPETSDVDASSPTDGSVVDTGTPTPPDAGGSDAGAKRDCSGDLDADGVWKHLECSGLYASLADKTVASDVHPYKPAVQLWSDGAVKQRWIWLPPSSKIDISDWDEWSFPPGTKLWKEFKLGGKRIETRLFTKLPDKTWAHTSYRWTADESDAVRKDGGESVPGLGPDGGAYEIPSAGQCDECHGGRKDHVLGFDAVSLGLPGADGETLAKLVSDGLLSQAPPATTLTLPGSSAAQAAVGWININCGACHNGNPNAAASFRAHYLVRASDLAKPDGGPGVSLQELDLWQQAYCVNAGAIEPDAGAPYKYIRGGSPDRSLMSILSGRRVAPDEQPNGSVQMPPIVSRAVDQQGHQLLDEWISSLQPCP